MKKLKPLSKHWKRYNKSHSALLVIDLQNYFLDPTSHAFVPDGLNILAPVNKAMETFRHQKNPVFLTRFAVKPKENSCIKEWWGATVKEGSFESELSQKLNRKHTDIVLRKTSYSAFKGTRLLQILKKQHIDSLVIGGVLTNLCCESTAREAFNEGFKVFILVDGTASYTEEMQLNSLTQLAYGFATPISINDL